MIKRIAPALLLSLVLLAGCSTRASDHDGARAPAARPESVAAINGETLYPGRISQTVQMQLHTDGRVTLQGEFTGTDHFKDWLIDHHGLMESIMGGPIELFEEGRQVRVTRTIEYDSVAEVNEMTSMELDLPRSPFFYGLTWKATTSRYSADDLAAVFIQPESNPVSSEAWGAYLLDAYHLRYLVTDERTGAQYSWERSAREIGSAGQTVSFVDKAWRPLAWVLLGLTGGLLAFVTWAGLVGQRVWSPQVDPS